MQALQSHLLCVALLAIVVMGERSQAAIFYVDSEGGDDSASGTSENTAWQSLRRVNHQKLNPGDQLLFRRGGLWRGQLYPCSGSNGVRVVYSAYGNGEKPIIQNAVSRNHVKDWEEVSPGVWATQSVRPESLQQIMDLQDAKWNIHVESGAAARVFRAQEQGSWFNRVVCQTSGQSPNHIQLWGPQLLPVGSSMLLRMRIRSTHPFKLDGIETLLNHAPYSCAWQGTFNKQEIGSEWQTVELLLNEQQKLSDAKLHINLGSLIPEDTTFDFDPIGLWMVKESKNPPITCDVGILILNHGETWGVKKWRKADLLQPLDYWYDTEKHRILVKFTDNPAKAFKSVELALTSHIINQNGKHDITYDGLMVRYGGAHGFGGANTRNLTIRNCDLCWIGGGLQFFKPSGEPVRYGNAIEFWNGAQDHLVERNRIWEIYDAALTNQGNGEDSNQINITYRDNVIWHAEYSFEFWNRPASAMTRNIVFEYNTCVAAGFCWSHSQRPDPNGAHLMFYQNASKTEGFIIRNNIFVETTEVYTRMENDWRNGLVLHNNLYGFGEKPIMRWQSKKYYWPSEFDQYQNELALDQKSLLAEPQFIDVAKHDYRLKPGSPGTTLATNGGAVGARYSTEE